VVSELILGTAGLGGRPYGKDGRVVSEKDAIALMKHAAASGITTFDTAPAYGDAERRIGAADCFTGGFTKTDGDVDRAITSMEHLGRRVSFLFHNWKNGGVPAWVSGVTVYAADRPHDIPAVCVQVDWNLLQQWLPMRTIHRIFARSVFLQGCLTGSGVGRRPELRQPIERAGRLAAAFGVSLECLALRAAIENTCIEGVVIGPTTMDELDACLEIARRRPLGDILIPMLACDDTKATDPRLFP
jgi:aryl-alcohol dehydrogenase-like predicted oxidoreductase